MKISAITVCYNSGKTIEHTLRSFYEQTHKNKEIIVVDGGSTDNTMDIVERYKSDNMIVVSEPDQGMYDAINKGLKLYRGDAFGILNSDDCYADKFAMQHIAEALEENDMVSGHLIFVDNHENRNVVRTWTGQPYHAKAMKRGWHPAHPTFYVRRKVADAVGLFNLEYPTASDYDWMVRAHECFDFSSGFIDEILVRMMVGGRSTSSLRSHIQHNMDSLRSRRRWMSASIIDFALFAKPLRKLRQFGGQ